MQAELGNAYCGTAIYKQNVSRERAARLAKVVQSEEIAALAESDVYWDKIGSIELVGEEDWDSVSKHPWYAQGVEIALFRDGYVLQNRGDLMEGAPRGGQSTTFTVRVQGKERQHVLFPRTVILVKGNEVIPLGTGQWPVEIGPVNGGD